MTIIFKSIYGINEDKNEIQFVAKLKKSIDNDMSILEFIEPSNNVQNRIEYNNDKVSIYAGRTTIDLELNKEIKNNFITEHGTIIIISILKNLIVTDNLVEIKYWLNDKKGNLINEFEISLTILKK